MLTVEISNIQKDAIIHAINRCRVPNLYFQEIMSVRNFCLGTRDWVQVASAGTVVNPNAISEINLTLGEIKAIIAIADLAKQSEVLEGVFAFPLEALKTTLLATLESHKGEPVK